MFTFPFYVSFVLMSNMNASSENEYHASSEIWTLISDIEDCSPYFPRGIGPPSLYINSPPKKRFLM